MTKGAVPVALFPDRESRGSGGLTDCYFAAKSIKAGVRSLVKLSDFLDKNCIIPQLHARDKKGVLEELAHAVSDNEPSVAESVLVKVLLERERLGSTGIGDGVAIPHGKLESLSHPIVSFGRSKEGLDFDSMDGQPVHLFFLLVAPENSSGIHLQALAKIAKMLKNSEVRKRLMNAEDRDEIYKEIIQSDDLS